VRLFPLLLDPPEALPFPRPDRVSRSELLLLLELPLLRLELLPLLLLLELLPLLLLLELLPLLLLLELLPLLLLLELLLPLLLLLELLPLLLLLELLSAPPCLPWARAWDTSEPATHSNAPATLNATM